MGIQFQLLPLKIIDYYFPECNVTLLPPTESLKIYNISKQFNISSSFTIVEKLKETAQVQVNIQLPNDPPEEEAYNLYFNISIVGLFENLSQKENLADIEDMAHINAAAMLIGAARERIAELTAGSPYGKYIIPALSVSGAIEK